MVERMDQPPPMSVLILAERRPPCYCLGITVRRIAKSLIQRPDEVKRLVEVPGKERGHWGGNGDIGGGNKDSACFERKLRKIGKNPGRENGDGTRKREGKSGVGASFLPENPVSAKIRCPAAHNAVGLAGESPAVGIDCFIHVVIFDAD